ncbi:sporozoite surface protein 2 [Leguminivora glycinivorella]|uniref:sporozoite surface protein 2 n=1 Tax=Leguminivora glycinivorella TaxID=1035111 RepID=UPI00200E858E|nr:sporozoite surface protein 2 [Leguminivora glycinivorella]
MGCRQFLSVCVAVACLYLAVITQGQGQTKTIPRTRFTCVGRTSGYYADVEAGCQVYHMCDGLGRQFSYTCPNTTLFQQRMLICDHWYMVNCSASEGDYDANLLIGQRDKPFVSEHDMQLRTPRPDILSVPPNNNYFDGLREAETKYAIHPSNSIVGIPDTISTNNGLDSAKQTYRPPTSWSTGVGRPRPNSQGSEDTGPSRPNRPTTYSQGTEDSFTGPSRPNRPTTYSQGSEDTTGPSRPITQQTEDSFPGASSKQTSNAQNRPHNQPRPLNRPERPRPTPNVQTNLPDDDITGAASQRPSPTFQPNTQNTGFTGSTGFHDSSVSSTTEASSEEFELDIRMKNTVDPVVNFINRFDPNSPDSHKTSMTKTEIINLNQQLPDAQVSSEEDRTPRRNKGNGNNVNRIADQGKGVTESSRFDTVNIKPTESFDPLAPSKELQPPKRDSTDPPTSTIGPPIYYEWKWAVPAFGLEPPKLGNISNENETETPEGRNVKTNPFSTVTRPTPVEEVVTAKNTEYNISSYFVPDYVFPLDKPHPGYEDENAETSFSVKVSRPGRASYGENPNCPQCHPAYVIPGTCEPCVVKR